MYSLVGLCVPYIFVDPTKLHRGATPLSLMVLLAPQSGAHTIAPHRDPTQPIPNPIHPLIAQRQQRPMMGYIFEKEIVQGPQKQCSHVSDIQIHKSKYTNAHKYTNTQIQFWSNYEIDLKCDIFLKRYKDFKHRKSQVCRIVLCRKVGK